MGALAGASVTAFAVALIRFARDPARIREGAAVSMQQAPVMRGTKNAIAIFVLVSIGTWCQVARME